MDNILDEILSIANGGCTAEKIQAFIAWEDNRVNLVKAEVEKAYKAAKQYGICYTINGTEDNASTAQPLAHPAKKVMDTV